MYLKLKQFIYDDEGINGTDCEECEIVPRKFEIYEAKRITYVRVNCENFEDFEKKHDKFSGGSCSSPFGIPLDKKFETFFIDLYDNLDDNVPSCSLVACNCIMYIMNDKGKTIDSDFCKQTHS